MDTNIFDPDYVQKQQVASLQAMAAQQNAVRVQTYTGQCATWITVNLRNRDLGVPPTPVPIVPKKIVVSDTGEWTEAPFADLQPPVLPAPVAVAPATGLRPAGPIPPDRLDQVIAILGVLNGKIERLLAIATPQS